MGRFGLRFVDPLVILQWISLLSEGALMDLWIGYSHEAIYLPYPEQARWQSFEAYVHTTQKIEGRERADCGALRTTAQGTGVHCRGEGCGSMDSGFEEP